MNMVKENKSVLLTKKVGNESRLCAGPSGKGGGLDRVWKPGSARAWLLALGAATLVSLLSGCASTPVSSSSGVFDYNSITGYPAVGDRPWHL